VRAIETTVIVTPDRGGAAACYDALEVQTSAAFLRSVALLLVAIWGVGCGNADPGWQRLWPDEWSWHDSGVQWVRGVPAAGRELYCTGSGLLFRADLLNLGSAPVTVRLESSRTEVGWTLGAGERQSVEVELSRGDARFEAPPGVVLGSPRLGRPLEEPRLIVLVLVDTLRADHVTTGLMPGVTGAFAGGRRWRDATANSSWTLPSVASLFSARPVLDLTSPEGEIIGIPDEMPTWASHLFDAGFEGGAMVANYTVHALNGFAAGFSSYRVPDGHGSEPAPDGAWVVDEARRWLAAHRGEDGFLYLHLMDPHEPYRRHGGVGPEPPPLKPLATRQRSATADETGLLRELYAGEVRHVDDVLTPFLAELPATAVVAFTSDHGEALGEHGAWGHGLNLYQEAIAVPLMVRGPGVTTGEVDEPVQLLDLGPTLLELCGRPVDGDPTSRSLLEVGAASPLVSATFSGGPLRWAWRLGENKVVLRMAAQPELGAVNRTRLHEVQPLPAGAFHVNLASDPAEERPGPIPDELMAEVGTAFAGSAGRLVPGLQLLIWGGAGPVTEVLEAEGGLEIVQAWSTGDIDVVRSGDRVEIRCADTDPLCAVSAAASSVPRIVTPMGTGWSGILPGQPIDPRRLEPPPTLDRGGFLWWNPERPLVVGGHKETLERLRVLGYID